ncbi:hypothetical protein ACGFMM_34350 [Streptomyces sp. NPDC048604]|uniref:hypothetical protein n=1 Tax=Streptomyces sp. NPDC048604 TaxID=3365578 RepID=UPI0037168946
MTVDNAGHVSHPVVIKEAFTGDLAEAVAMAESATHLGLGVHISNSMHHMGGELKEMWDVVIVEDIPLHDREASGAAALARVAVRQQRSQT